MGKQCGLCAVGGGLGDGGGLQDERGLPGPKGKWLRSVPKLALYSSGSGEIKGKNFNTEI